MIDLDNIDGTDRPHIPHPAATPEQAALLLWAYNTPTGRPHPEAANGAYILPDPDTGEEKRRTRVTTFTSALDDGEGLTKWKAAITMRGLINSPTELRQAAKAASGSYADLRGLYDIADQVAHNGGDKLAADIGTALHLATEHHDLGTGHRPPDPYGADVDAYAKALHDNGLTVLPDWVERTVITPQLDTAGTLDRLVQLADGRIVLLDLKTGKGVKKVGYAAQAAVYANAKHAWTPDGYEPLPDVDKTLALIAHLPAGSGTCEFIAVDITAGWDRALACQATRAARSIKGIFTAYKGQPVPVDENTERTAETRERLAALKGNDDHMARIVDLWPADTPRKPPWTDAHLDALNHALHAVDGQESAFLGSPDPARVAAVEERTAKGFAILEPPAAAPDRPAPDDGGLVDAGDADAIISAITKMPKERKQRAAAWGRQAKADGQPWGSIAKTKMTTRTWALNQAAMRCTMELHDDDEPDALTRAALSIVIGEDVQPSWSTGAVIGTLAISEAHRLEALAAAFGAGDQRAASQLGLAATATNNGATEQ
ncbi:MAG: hypothetical protein ABIP03_04960 [Aquihabitans sp.]